MLAEEWKNIHNLLILSLIESQNEFELLLLSKNLIQKVLPLTQVQFLVSTHNQHNNYASNTNIKIKSLTPSNTSFQSYVDLIYWIKSCTFEVAIVLTNATQSPFCLAYLCYLAAVPIRVGYSQEFGGGVLSHCIKPPMGAVSIADYNLHLLKSIGFPRLDLIDCATA